MARASATVATASTAKPARLNAARKTLSDPGFILRNQEAHRSLVPELRDRMKRAGFVYGS